MQRNGSFDQDDIPEGHDHFKYFSADSMRVQLWDAFRLARCILDEPVKERRLHSHLMLHAIRKVAEMKLQLQQMQLEMAQEQFQKEQFYLDEAARAAASVGGVEVEEGMTFSEAVLSTLPPETVSPDLKMDDLKQQQLETAQHALDHVLDTSQQGQLISKDEYDLHKLEDVLGGINDEQKRTPKGLTGVHALVSPDTTSSLTFFSSEMSEDGQSTVRQDLDESHSSDPVEDLRLEILTQPSLEHDARRKIISKNPPSSLSSKPSVDEYNALRQKSREQHQEIESMLRALDSKVHETSQSTASNLKDLHEKLANAQLQQVKNLRQQEQWLKSSPRSTTLEIKNARLARQQSKQQHDQVNTMLAMLHAKIHQTSAQTSAQIQELYKTLEQAKLHQENVHQKALVDIAQQIQEQELAQKAHFDAVLLQYLQQQGELEEQLKESQDLLQEAENDLQILRQKYQQLEAMVVTPFEAQQVLEKLMVMEVEMQKRGFMVQGKRQSNSDAIKTGKQISQVNQEVIALLSRMADKKMHQEHQKDGWAQYLETAKKKEAKSLEELDFLKLQKELLVEDTTKITEDEIREMCAAEKQKYQEELAAISEAEGQRQKEMESLEEELTHLAFLAVQIEECEKEFREQQAHYQASLKELRAQNQASTAKLGHLQGDVQHAINQQAAKVQGGIKEMSSQISAADLRILELERALAKRDANLASVKSELQLSQERVKLLESAISSQ
jgi:hypothetical protein